MAKEETAKVIEHLEKMFIARFQLMKDSVKKKEDKEGWFYRTFNREEWNKRDEAIAKRMFFAGVEESFDWVNRKQ